MTTSNLTIVQRGNHVAGTWTSASFNLVNLNSNTLAWIQVDKSVPLVNLAIGLTIQFNPNFVESGTLTVLTLPRTAVTDDFSPTNLPTPTTTVTTLSVAFNAVPIVLTLPLTDAHGKGTALHGEMRTSYRAPHRFAIGFGWSEAVGGDAFITNCALTYTDEFTGWGGRRGTAGVDRAVRCPRCGNVMKEAELVRDGYTLSDVCARCFDPDPQAQPPLRWPFNG
jgi:hypothetical protein